MTKIKSLSIITVCALVFTNSAFAMDLSFKNAVDKIITESNDLKKADANLNKAHAALDAANANRWFNIKGSANYMKLINVENPNQEVQLPAELGGLIQSMTGGVSANSIQMPDNILMAGVDITQPIYTFGKIGNAVDGVRSAIKMSESGKEIAKREVKYAAAQIYWTAKMTDGIVVAAEKSLSDTKSAYNKLTSAGRANKSNLVKIEADIATKEITVSDAKFNRDTAYRMLKIMAGIKESEELNLTDNMPEKFDELNASDIKSNPEWEMLNEQIKMYESNVHSKRAGNYPTLAAMGSYSYMALDETRNVFDGNKTQSAYAGLSLQVPIFDGGLNRANATMEAMNAEAARQDLDKSKKIKTEEYNTAIKKYEHLCLNLKNLNNARDLAQKAYNISSDRFASGQTSAVELSDVSASLSQLDMAILNTKYNILMSVETVKKLGE